MRYGWIVLYSKYKQAYSAISMHKRRPFKRCKMIGEFLSSMFLYALIAGIIFLGYGILQDIKHARKSEQNL